MTTEPRQRADAARNRARILAAAEEVFAREGLAVPIDRVARHAGLGVGTLYRHFPDKDALFAAIVHDRMQRIAAHARALLTAPDPGRACFDLLTHLVAEGFRKRHFVEALGGRLRLASDAETAKLELHRTVAELLTRAQRAGAVRQGLDATDLFALVRGLFAAAGDDPHARSKYLSILLDGLRPAP